MDLQFNPLTEKDSSACYSMHRQGQFSPWSRKIFEDCFTAPYFANHVTLDEQIIGYYIGLSVLDEATLMDIVLIDAQQGKGFGKHLLNHFINHCASQKKVQVWLEVRESNHTAINMYEKAGFVLIEQRKNYYPAVDGKEDALIMGLYVG